MGKESGKPPLVQAIGIHGKHDYLFYSIVQKIDPREKRFNGVNDCIIR